ncbi:hypothetical protein ASPCAL10760 [Aspergillus calidoustus]|uniref:Kinetochore complex Sim4 subunit Fta1-domain-containing protein n=1 Tax=Aspergillus calidoustus TaxID=454130 RepID=A0A0U5G7N5_ASPCI|nr:hypothetical protein ASPCAL10760 [Aspergillus calidoustus]
MASPHHLLNTSWTSHRLSPLYHGSEHSSLLGQPALEIYANRLRDHLTNSLADAQGWRAPEEDTAGVSNTGALNSCTWEPITSLSFLSPQSVEDDDEDAQPVGILITFGYEHITYKAALLANPSISPSDTSQKGKQPQRGRSKRTPSTSSSTSTSLPLLLTRLPKALREQFIAFLSSNFDTCVSSLRFSSDVLCDLLQSYVGNLTSAEGGSGGEGADSVLIEDIIREMHLTLSFAPPIATSLKTLNVSIPRETIASFLRTTTGSSPAGDGTENSGRRVLSGLSAYLQKHLAMELGLELGDGGVTLSSGYVRLTKIACAGFVITGEGRIKVVGKVAQEGEDEGTRDRRMLMGGEALVRAVLGRANAGIQKGKS